MVSYSLNQYLPPTEPLPIYRGDTHTITITLTNSDNTAVDLTGATVLAEIRKVSDNSQVLDSGSNPINFTASAAANGVVTLSLSASQASELPIEILKSDVQITISGDVTTYVILRLQVVADVSGS